MSQEQIFAISVAWTVLQERASVRIDCRSFVFFFSSFFFFALTLTYSATFSGDSRPVGFKGGGNSGVLLVLLMKPGAVEVTDGLVLGVNDVGKVGPIVPFLMIWPYRGREVVMGPPLFSSFSFLPNKGHCQFLNN